MLLANQLRYFGRPDSRFVFSVLNSSSFWSLSTIVASPPTPEFPINERARRRLFSLSFASGMDASPTCSLVLSGKTAVENETAKLLKRNDTLKLPDDTEISVLLHSEKDKPLEENGFRIDLYLNALSTDTFGRFLIWSPRVPSTQDVISHNFSNLPLGAVCVADVQFKGRGRSKNLWESPPGCLMFSFTIQMEDGRIVPLLQYVISLAITEAIKDICDKEGLPYIDLKIKWPNDLYVNDLKVGGVLCTSTYRLKKFNVTAGIGLNVDNDKPSTCLNEALTNLSSTPYKFRKEDILAFFFNKFERLYDVFINQGFRALEELYYQTWLHSGQRVVVQEKKEDQVVENVVTIQGLTSSGYLLAIGDDYQMCELHPDGNSLDFFKGLIKSKLV
ncbi:biotin--protein ligase 2 [Cucumis sativus]|uniref:biotin--protein ligase 2 n=1 Tax=Cucumis sativus TaxID=3659 RepID=UPI0005ED015D|nr:biotin--protein ligase 2 [Cucumis sativus]KAE8650720.1 hypothetical protein Csa_011733 [Cucumis sativus]